VLLRFQAVNCYKYWQFCNWRNIFVDHSDTCCLLFCRDFQGVWSPSATVVSAVPVSLEAGGGIPCRPNLAATLLVINNIILKILPLTLVGHTSTVLVVKFISNASSSIQSGSVEDRLSEEFGMIFDILFTTPEIFRTKAYDKQSYFQLQKNLNK